MSKDSKDKSIHINPVKKKDSVEEHSSLEMRYLRSRLPNCDEGFFIDALELEDGNPFSAFKIIEEKDTIKVFGITSPENLNQFSLQERRQIENWREEYAKKKDSLEEHSSLEMRYLRSRLPNCDEGFFIDALALEDGNPFAAFKIIEEKDAIKVFGITSPENLNRFSSQERKHLEKWRAEYIKQETIQKERALSASSNAVHSGSSLSLNNQQKNNSK